MIDALKQEKFVAILRNIPAEKLENTVKALFEGGIRIFEVTFNPSKKDTVETTKKSLEFIKSEFGKDAHICAGTVIFPEFVTAAHEAGAQCIVSPNTDEKIIKLTKKYGMLSMPGAYTPSEIMTAYNLGADIVKIFPVLPDQIAYLKTVISPLSHIPFVTTGGVNLSNAADFLNCGAIAVAAGVTLIPNEYLEKDDYSAIKENAGKFVKTIKG